jgi:hypothetical protein
MESEPMEPTEGKIATIKKQSRKIVATAPARAIAEAARSEVAPLLAEIIPMVSQVDAISKAIQSMPEQFQSAAGGSALALRESLTPVLQSVGALKTSLDQLPILLSQQMDGAMLQIQTERKGIQSSLDSLPTRLRMQLSPIVSPILEMGTRMDSVLDLHRAGYQALHDESLRILEVTVHDALEVATDRMTFSATALMRQGKRTETVLKQIREVPTEMHQAATAMNKESARAAKRISQASKEATEALRKSSGWHPLTQAAATALVVLGALLGAQWLGTIDLRLPLPGNEMATKAAAWDKLYLESSPEMKAWMDRHLDEKR